MMFNYCGKYQERFVRFNDFIYIFNNILRGIFCIEGKGWLSYACSLEFIYFSRAILKRWEVINYSVIYLSHQVSKFLSSFLTFSLFFLDYPERRLILLITLHVIHFQLCIIHTVYVIYIIFVKWWFIFWVKWYFFIISLIYFLNKIISIIK